jgi:hypothetical protein
MLIVSSQEAVNPSYAIHGAGIVFTAPAASHGDTERIVEVIVGQARYRFKTPHAGVFDLWEGVYHVGGLPYQGHGAGRASARKAWNECFHVRFQELYAKRPFEQTPEEKAEWEMLMSVVDVYDYTNATPMRRRSLGMIVSKRDRMKIRWANGRSVALDYGSIPPDTAGFPPGRWVEAIIEEDPITGRILRLSEVTPVAAPRAAGSKALEGFIDSLPGSAALPSTEI